jgi:hypothetical protein
MSRNPEIKLFEPTPYVYPKGYFQAQVSFSDRVLKLGLSPNIQSSILNYTVVYRHLVGKNLTPNGLDPKWLEFTRGLSEKCDVFENVWKFYTSQSHSVYSEKSNKYGGEHFGSFVQRSGIDKSTNEQKIEIHFVNQRRGQTKSDFSRVYSQERIHDLTRLFCSVKSRIDSESLYKPKWVTLISWMNNFPGVRASLPPTFVNSEVVVQPAELNFRSNSLWGQFLSNDGGVNMNRYQQFQESLPNANNLKQLVNCFPLRVTSFRSPIEIFLNHYGIK